MRWGSLTTLNNCKINGPGCSSLQCYDGIYCWVPGVVAMGDFLRSVMCIASNVNCCRIRECLICVVAA